MKIRHKKALAIWLLAVFAVGAWAAIDSAAKRSSALSVSTPAVVLVVPDGTIGAADRQTIAGMYGGLAAGGDATPPMVSSSVIGTNGTAFTVNFDEAVSQGAGYADTDFTLTCSGGAATLTYSSGDTTGAHVYTISRTVQGSPTAETCTLAHDGSANSLEDAAGNDLAAFSGATVTNGSTQDTIAPTVTAAQVTADVLRVSTSETTAIGAGGGGGFTLTSCSGGAVTPTFVSAGAVLTFSLSRELAADETGCVLGYTQPTNGVEDLAGNDLATLAGQSVSIRSGCVGLVGPVVQSVVSPAVVALQCVR